jgi:hypothetical protein
LITHPVLEYIAGDDWQVVATLLDENGAPYDLTGAQIKWILFDDAHNHIVDEAFINIVGDPADGVVSVIVPANVTAPIASGSYSDALRVTIAHSTATLSMGRISVIENPETDPTERFGRFDIVDMSR